MRRLVPLSTGDPMSSRNTTGRRGFLGRAAGAAVGTALVGGGLEAAPASAAARSSAGEAGAYGLRPGDRRTGGARRHHGLQGHPLRGLHRRAEPLAGAAARAVMEGRARGGHLGRGLPAAGHRDRRREGAAAERGLPEPQHLDGCGRFEGAPPGVRVDLRRPQLRHVGLAAGLRRRQPGRQGRGRRHLQPPRRRLRQPRPPRAERGGRARRLRQLGCAGHGGGAQVDPAQHRRVRRRPGPGDHHAAGRTARRSSTSR